MADDWDLGEEGVEMVDLGEMYVCVCVCERERESEWAKERESVLGREVGWRRGLGTEA